MYINIYISALFTLRFAYDLALFTYRSPSVITAPQSPRGIAHTFGRIVSSPCVTLSSVVADRWTHRTSLRRC